VSNQQAIHIPGQSPNIGLSKKTQKEAKSVNTNIAWFRAYRRSVSEILALLGFYAG
jgi:hypothetical protein